MRNLTIPEKILVAVSMTLKERDESLDAIFTRNEVWDKLHRLDQSVLKQSFHPQFQAMRVDQPGNAPFINKKFRGVFKRVERGKYILTDKGKELVRNYSNQEIEIPSTLRRDGTTRQLINHQCTFPQVNELIENFEVYINVFNEEIPFQGPDLYFHRKTIDRWREHEFLESLLGDDMFFEYLYATLTSWWFRRPNALLRDLHEIRESIFAQQQLISNYFNQSLVNIQNETLIETMHDIWEIIKNLEIGITNTVLIINSKALHHILPDLVPPIDRGYVLKFFFGHTNIYNERNIFFRIFPCYVKIARHIFPGFNHILNNGWHSSISKVIDNAIIGYVLSHH